jgi:hypothetical protein
VVGAHRAEKIPATILSAKPLNGLAMTKLANIFLACLIAAVFVVVPTLVLAGQDDNPNYGYCKSGELVSNIKYCKENGGKF